jgi:hypothetical protein
MAKFLDKKEQVYDLKLTSYGRYLLSTDKFDPVYYAFFDDNVLYDGAYAGITESQNDIHERIKNNTQYLEGLVLFQEVEQPSNFVEDGTINYFKSDITPTMEFPRKDTFHYDAMIGDAYLEGDTNVAPAWKAVTLSGRITSSSVEDVKNREKIPQVNLEVNYFKQIFDVNIIDDEFDNEYLRSAINTSPPFSDNKVIKLIADDVMVYVEELNTALLTKNFDLEVFEIHFNAITSSCVDCGLTASDGLMRKFFNNNPASIKGGYLDNGSQDFNTLRGINRGPNKNTSSIGYYYDVLSSEVENRALHSSTSSVNYYFDIVYDYQIDNYHQNGKEAACKAAELFNKKSYYIDLDFDCKESQTDGIYVDIYGQATEPEICQ